ncbi:MAG: endonuclease [Saprospiraceae bacterium]|nr:endonuclease [Saprospiraceae bacterium]
MDHYSESNSNVFEPSNPLKGDIARAIFYFYTIYGATMLTKTKSFFTSMLPDICRWHRKDVVDSTEIRSHHGHRSHPVQCQSFYL